MKNPVREFALWLEPDRREQCLGCITAGYLKKKNIKALILDLDNTFLPWKSSEIPRENLEWAEKLRAEGIRLFVLSNTTRPDRMKMICEKIQAGWLHPAAKPNRKSFLRAAGMLGVKPEEISVVGDQLFTDMLGGRLAGMHTILVKQISKREFFGTRYISRPAEKLLSRYMKGAFTGNTREN